MSEKTVILGDDSPEIKVPLMTLREVVMFPRTIVPLYVGRKASIQAVEQALEKYNKKIFLVTQKNPGDEEPGSDDLFEVGVVCKILQMMRMPDGTIKVLFEGSYRARWSSQESLLEQQDRPFPVVTVERVQEDAGSGTEVKALINLVQGAIKRFSGINKKLTQDVVKSLNSIEDPGRLADMIMSHLKVDFQKAQKVLEIMEPVTRLEEAYGLLLNQIEYSETEQKINSRVKEQVEANQKNYYLNEQLKAIQKEMGADQDSGAEADELLERLEAKAMPEEAREKGRKEIQKLKQIPPSSAEYTVVRNYVDCILDLPWDELKETCQDIDQAARILDEDHFGLEKPKERILEYLAVQTLVEKLQGQILCFVGPPGVGKTSLARSISRATDREFVRLSLGGVRDEAEIRGHRRTYIGALPGKILQSLKRKEYNNPVICLDEVDKMSTDFRGDPSSALLEVLDPEQNYAFSDHYLDLDYDLSNVFFITTANTLQTIPWALRDRMEIIRLPGYLETEKMKIARSFLLPKQLKRHGLKEDQVHISDGAVQEVIRKYTREAGVRNLERELASVYRKVAKKIVQGTASEGRVLVNKNSVSSYLGVPNYRHEEREDKARVGLSVGLAWTEMGGELLMIEAVLMAGTGKIEVTGTIGDVMQESAKAALSYVRSRTHLFGLKPEFYKEVDIHIHIPEGATPKDGPSAGITMSTALVSALLNMPVDNAVAMTGEITLRGRVLPIGGLREKLLAAHRGRVSKVIIPRENNKDLKDVPREILRDLEIVQVDHMDEVLPQALVNVQSEEIFCGPASDFSLINSLRKEEYQPQRH
ncbi:MAG: endopeptidase La [Desulfohalobiaceae bacterium]|nr:endopeptidase La [Desulfohalobiaceae bacterium]